ncbi:b78babff-9f92-4df4-9b0e-64afb6b0ebed [Thermothielavioides terrestris]|uniref:B78babff-9f92-4df4-9b0e-64afb6b0ebed n=1 Tax=Thermothielavioides terrestris TaxID=2587410 RepID=A0A3S4ALE3_9PEZI|nr:b78babff-9f92-4df4-9b0e-64afb6b0ebed [Thermothielavioides terrestris]
MPSFDRVYASSPVLAMLPQAAHPVSLGKSFLEPQTMSLSQPASWPTQLVSTSLAAGRKRSRDEASVNLDPPEKVTEAHAIKEPEDEWIYGPGMTLIKKSAGYVADASSQSGTWVEERAAEEEARKAEAARLAREQLAQSRPSLRSHKSQRLDMTTALNAADKLPSRQASPAREAINSMTLCSDSLAQPIVDDFTLHLGIGWSRISDDEPIQAAARGWARFIENHYPVTNARILLKSRGLESYLVETTEGYFLFAENLRQGRLVSQTPKAPCAT